MKKRRLVSLMLLAALILVFGTPSVADKFKYTGWAALDVGLVVLNKMAKGFKNMEDMARVWRDRPKRLLELKEYKDSIQAWSIELRGTLRDFPNKFDQLERDKQSRLRDAGFDEAKRQKIERDSEARRAELQKSKELVEESIRRAADIQTNLQLCEKNLRTANNIDEWYGPVGLNGKRQGGLSQNFNVARTKLEARFVDFQRISQEADQLFNAKSSIDIEQEKFATFDGRVDSVSGTVEFYVGDRKLESGAPISIGSDRKVVIRALLVGERRKKVREFKMTASGNSQLTTKTDHELAYSVQRGDFSAETTWAVKEESYTWNPRTKTGRPLKTRIDTSPGLPAGVKDNLFEFVFAAETVSESVILFVTGRTEWEMNAVRNGRPFNDYDEDDGSSTITIIISPI